jgi:EAL domain-containing protein (putative c-di-GMP-specific phosphodiesterase class I)
LRELGVQIAMDDFGTGYSSLSYLRRFPFDRIKIDKSFINELGKQDDCIAIVRAVIALARDLGIEITAEGVETRQQLEMLEQAGCDEIQGYLFSRPVPEAAVMALLRSMPVLAEIWPAADVPVRSRPVEDLEHVPADFPRAMVRPALTAGG